MSPRYFSVLFFYLIYNSTCFFFSRISVMSLKGFSLASVFLWKMFSSEFMPHKLLLLLLLGVARGIGHGLQENLKPKFIEWWGDFWSGIGSSQALDSALLNSLWRSLPITLSSFPDLGIFFFCLFSIILFFVCLFFNMPNGNREGCIHSKQNFRDNKDTCELFWKS